MGSPVHPMTPLLPEKADELQDLAEEKGKEPSIQRLYTAITLNESRNERLVDDVVHRFQSGGNILVLTERTAHVTFLVEKLRGQIPDVIALTGGKRNP